jgi:hemolysin III
MRTMSSPSPVLTTPRLRGWSHAVAAFVAVVATVGLAARGRQDPPLLGPLLVYGASLIFLFTASAVYHLGAWQGRLRTLFRAIDHAGIFVVIAGTYTPVCVTLLSGDLRTWTLVLIWALAASGVGVSIAPLELPRWTRVGLYAGMGWGAIVPTAGLVQSLPPQATALLIAGGLLFSIGAVIYARRSPDPLPHLFGFHELFHLFVIAGSVAFFAVIWTWIVPFPRA